MEVFESLKNDVRQTFRDISLLFFFGVNFRPTREFFTYLETSAMPVKGCNF